MTTKINLPADRIKKLAIELGFDAVGIAPSAIVEDAQNFHDWMYDGYAGEMDYLGRNVDLRRNPELLLPGARSIVVIGLNYYPTEKDIAAKVGRFNVAMFAWGEDYHNIIRQKLRQLRNRLRESIPGLKARICVDTAPFMDKYWAQKAGIGWIGKHTNLVSRKFGSWLLIGSLILSAECDRYDTPHTNHCGRCTACLDACPTGALIEPYRLDARPCISYLTIESKSKTIPDDFRENLNGWVFGCDICLRACPFNKFQKSRQEPEFARRDAITTVENGSVVELTDGQFDELFQNSPINRPGPEGIRRNIAAAASSR
jgi:epoxyqueuosine reductase